MVMAAPSSQLAVARRGVSARRYFAIAVGSWMLPLFSCGSVGSSVLSVEIDGIRSDAATVHFKLYRADCFGSHPCSTWLAQTNVPQSSPDRLSYQLSLPSAVYDLPVYLRVETTLTASACVGARATASVAKNGSDYAGAGISVDLSADAAGPPFQIAVPNVCPFVYAPQGKGSGTVVLTRAGYADVTDPAKYPDEFPRMALITVTAMPKAGSQFLQWTSPAGCAGQTQSSCAFYMTDLVRLTPVFDPLRSSDFRDAAAGVGKSYGRARWEHRKLPAAALPPMPIPRRACVKMIARRG